MLFALACCQRRFVEFHRGTGLLHILLALDIQRAIGNGVVQRGLGLIHFRLRLLHVLVRLLSSPSHTSFGVLSSVALATAALCTAVSTVPCGT